jgi:D-alanyl-D-alanine carboxypeptidase
MLKHPNYNGLKTGITEAAGPCLSASYKNSKDSRQWYIIILLNSKSMIARWEEVPLLVDYAKNYFHGINRLPQIFNNSMLAPPCMKKENSYMTKSTMTSTRSNSKQHSNRNSFTRAHSTINK